jgi:hypothetical protein
MITCYLRYIIDPSKLNEFEAYGKMWIPLVEKFGGQHHGYFLPSEGANNVALALFSFPSLSTYESYRQQSQLRPAMPGGIHVCGRNEVYCQLRAQLLSSRLQLTAD